MSASQFPNCRNEEPRASIVHVASVEKRRGVAWQSSRARWCCWSSRSSCCSSHGGLGRPTPRCWRLREPAWRPCPSHRRSRSIRVSRSRSSSLRRFSTPLTTSPLASCAGYRPPLAGLVLIAVVMTTAAVAWAAVALRGLPLAAAITLGAVVAPPDAAAAAAVLSQFRLPRRMLTILQGESLLNDAVALLIFGAAVSAAAPCGPRSRARPSCSRWPCPEGPRGNRSRQDLPPSDAVGGGDAVRLHRPVRCHVRRVAAGGAPPDLADHDRGRLRDDDRTLHPAVQRPGVRIHSHAIWEAVVFVLNVLAFLLMGLQARSIVGASIGTSSGAISVSRRSCSPSSSSFDWCGRSCTRP